jgi:FlaA1/EpsC-like NDP-sugar epimerase
MIKLVQPLKNLSRSNKLLVVVIADFIIAFLCWMIFGPPASILIASGFDSSLVIIIYQNLISFLIPVLLTFVYFIYSGFYRSLMKFFNSKDSIFKCLIGAIIFGFSWGVVYLYQYEVVRTNFLTTVMLQALLLAAVFYAFIQISRDIASLLLYPESERNDAKPVLIYGAGSAGNELYQAIRVDPKIKVIGFFDNSYKLQGAQINGITIYGKKKHIKNLVLKNPGLEVYLAIPSLSTHERRQIISSLENYKIAVRSMPALHEVVANEKMMVEMQDLSIDDLLPRTRVRKSEVSHFNKTILITGAGGSIGSEIANQIIQGNAKKVVLFEISEINLYNIEAKLKAINLSANLNVQIVSILGDVKNKDRLIGIIKNHNIEYIYHAAAYKHVPIVEYYENISEGIKNNIFGTKSLCEAAAECKVKKVVVISTDKAVRPTNIMGASKRFAEMITQSMDKRSSETVFCMVRFGNVINSSGSVIPLFRKQISQGGPVTVTHREVTRFFMTISEASSLVIQAGEYAEGGDIFILDMGEQVKITDLAEKLIHLSGRNIKKESDGEGIGIKEIGLRPGEKLFEELLISGKETKTPNSKIYKSLEEPYPEKIVLDKVIAELEKFAKINDHENIIKILKEQVEGYVQENENKY